MRHVVLLLLFAIALPLQAQDDLNQLVSAKLSGESENPLHAMLLYVEHNSEIVLDRSFGRRNKGQSPASTTDTYRIASATKTFVATVILQLVMEKKVKLQDKISDHLSLDYIDFDRLHMYEGQSFGPTITIEQLLAHRSGLGDIFTDKGDAFFSILMENPQHQYSPEEIVDLYFQFNLNTSPHFQPGDGWNYSDMNYVLLGLLIEAIDNEPLAASIRDRILNPIGMRHTFFEYYEAPDKHPFIHQYFGSVDMTEINTSFDWAGGGLVSTNQDLSFFIKALFDGKLINKKMLSKMTDVRSTKNGENRYGLGIYESDYNGDIYYGHYGFFGSYIGYAPQSKKVLSYCISQATPEFNVYGFINDLLLAVE